VKKNPVRLAIIGLGHIARVYKQALKASGYTLACVCDTSPSAVNRHMYREIPFYRDYETMLAREDVDVALVATPPASHLSVAKTCLSYGVDVLMEKPATLARDALETLLDYEEAVRHTLRVMYHLRYANEVLAFLSDDARDDAWDLEGIDIVIHDPYVDEDGRILPERTALGGAWFDSGINALSLIECFTPLEVLEPIDVSHVVDETNGLPVYIKQRLLADGIPTAITIDWRRRASFKKTTLYYSDKTVELDHTAQSLLVNGERIYKSRRKDPLVVHYENLFTHGDSEGNLDLTRKLHEYLFKLSP